MKTKLLKKLRQQALEKYKLGDYPTGYVILEKGYNSYHIAMSPYDNKDLAIKQLLRLRRIYILTQIYPRIIFDI